MFCYCNVFTYFKWSDSATLSPGHTPWTLEGAGTTLGTRLQSVEKARNGQRIDVYFSFPHRSLTVFPPDALRI